MKAHWSKKVGNLKIHKEGKQKKLAYLFLELLPAV